MSDDSDPIVGYEKLVPKSLSDNIFLKIHKISHPSQYFLWLKRDDTILITVKEIWYIHTSGVPSALVRPVRALVMEIFSTYTMCRTYKFMFRIFSWGTVIYFTYHNSSKLICSQKGEGNFQNDAIVQDLPKVRKLKNPYQYTLRMYKTTEQVSEYVKSKLSLITAFYTCGCSWGYVQYIVVCS